MSAEQARPRPAAARERVGDEKLPAPRPGARRPAVHPALAFTTAGAAAVVASSAALSASAWRGLYHDAGVSLPALVELVVLWPVATPALLLGAGVVVLVLGALPAQRRLARAAALAFALLTGLTALLLFGAELYAFIALDRRL